MVYTKFNSGRTLRKNILLSSQFLVISQKTLIKWVYLGFGTLWLKQSITKSMVLHTTDKSLEELHLIFTTASSGKQHCIARSMLLILFYVTAEDKTTCNLQIQVWLVGRLPALSRQNIRPKVAKQNIPFRICGSALLAHSKHLSFTDQFAALYLRNFKTGLRTMRGQSALQ